MEARLQMMNVSQAAEAPSGASIQFPPFFIFSRKFVSKINFFKFFKRQIIKLSFHGKCNRRPNQLKHRNSNETLELKCKLLILSNCPKTGQLKPLLNPLIFKACPVFSRPNKKSNFSNFSNVKSSNRPKRCDFFRFNLYLCHVLLKAFLCLIVPLKNLTGFEITQVKSYNSILYNHECIRFNARFYYH